MKKLNVRFELDEELSDIEIIVRAGEKSEQVKAIIESFVHGESDELTLFDQNGKACVVEQKDVVFLTADGKQVKVVTKSDEYYAKKSLQSMEKLLRRDFLRVSRFEIINLKMVSKFDFTIGGTLCIEFKNGMKTWASRRYIPIIRERLSEEEGYLC